MSQRNLQIESWIKSFSSLLESCVDLHCSMQEKDLHTKRTLHTEFSDKTAEAAKPIVLESSNVGASTSGNVSEANPAQMVQPEVNKELLAELESMGFATPRATRALHFTGFFLMFEFSHLFEVIMFMKSCDDVHLFSKTVHEMCLRSVSHREVGLQVPLI
jgi:hypothetical protein